MEELERDKRHQLRANLVTMETAVVRAWDRVFSNDPLARNTPRNRDRLAHALGAMMPVYTYDEKHIQLMTYEDLRIGNFTDSGANSATAAARKSNVSPSMRASFLARSVGSWTFGAYLKS
jgi:hypothetical protein